MRNLLPLWVAICLTTLLTSCDLKDTENSSDAQPHGYALLYSITSQEQEVDKLLWVKKPGDEIAAWVTDIADFNGKVTKQLEAWKKDGALTNLKDTGLPKTENKARDRASSRVSGELLWGAGVDLRLELILSQLSALGYCADLCYAIAGMPEGKANKDTLDTWSKEFIDLNNRGMKLLESGTYLKAKKEIPHGPMREVIPSR